MGKFLYFGYGSNLLSSRIHLKNPSAIFQGVAKLKDHRLDFDIPSNFIPKNWGGASATIVPESGSHVWGAMWELDDSDLQSLDDQESVRDRIYKRTTVQVTTPNGNDHSCLAYCFVNQPDKLESESTRANDRLPSSVYMKVIIRGAEESGLPQEYISYLKTISTNGFRGGPECPVKFDSL